MGYETLVYAIFRQAFEDYNELISCGLTYSTRHKCATKDENAKRVRTPAYSLEEIQDFFNGGWCDTLLSVIDKDEDRTMLGLINTAKEGEKVVKLDMLAEYKGESHLLSEWAEIHNINYTTLFYRLTSGWDLESALTTPVRKTMCAI